MTMPLNLFLVRHGESEGNVASAALKKGDRSYYENAEFSARHNTKYRLTDRGVQQACDAGDWFTQQGYAMMRCVTSPALRSMETALYLGLPKAQWYQETFLREREWGLLDSMPPDKREEAVAEFRRALHAEPLFAKALNGESLADTCFRIDRPLQTLHRECSGGNVVIVSHGEVMWCLRMRMERIPEHRYAQLDKSKHPHDRIHNCQILHYTRENPHKQGDVRTTYGWLRSICPWNTNLSSNEWKPIERYTFDAAAIRRWLDKYPQLLAGKK
jgi:broad specificity phosphatase PhoE